MKKNKLNKKVVIGTWSLGGNYGHVNKRIIYKSIERAINNDFLEFDTSPNYGNGKMHNILSEILKNEKKIKINTKCGYNADYIKTFKTQDIIRAIDSSLEKFGKINTLFLHNPRNEIKNWSKIINVLTKYKQKNHINSIGISLARDFYFTKKIMNEFDYLQDDINLLRPGKINYLTTFEPKIMARSPLASGCLSGKLSLKNKFSTLDHRSKWLSDKKRLKNILFQINQIKKITGKDLRSFAKNFLLQNKNINKIIFGIKKPEHIDELIFDIKIKPDDFDLNCKKIFELYNRKFNLEKDQIGY